LSPMIQDFTDVNLNFMSRLSRPFPVLEITLYAQSTSACISGELNHCGQTDMGENFVMCH
jgi:hypothetical protein